MFIYFPLLFIMEIRNLRSFVCVAETSSFSVAAERCYLTQSAISQHIKSLESALNCKLLIRNSHDITLTESGEALFTKAKEILKQVDDFKEQINAINNCITGELRIGVGSFIAPYIRKTAMAFMQRYPNVKLSVEFGKACRLNQMLREHKIDMAFTMNTAYDEEGINTEPCIPFYISAIMSKRNHLAALERVSFKDLLKHNIIMPDVSDRALATFQKYIHEDLSKLNVKAIVSSPDEALSVIDEGNLITFLPNIYLRNHPELTARPIVGLERKLMSNAHWMRDVPMKKSAQLFLDIMKEETIPYLIAIQTAV